jgi:hypothetical protein
VTTHITVTQALAFSTDKPEGVFSSVEVATPTEEDCRRFIAWHSRGKSFTPLTPGLFRLIAGFKAMGTCLGREDNPESWAYGFKYGLLFLSDFLDDQTPELERVMAFDCYRRLFGFIPSCYSRKKEDAEVRTTRGAPD